MPAIIAGRPGIPIAVGCAGLESNLPRFGIHRCWRVPQNIGNIPRGDRRKQTHPRWSSFRGNCFAQPMTQHNLLAPPRQPHVKLCQIGERQPQPPKRDRQCRLGIPRQLRIKPRLLQPREEPLRSDRVERTDRRNIQRLR